MGEAVNLYNAFLSETHKLPAQIIITSPDGKIRHELLRPAEGAPEKSDMRCWLPGFGATVGRELIIAVARPTDGRARDSRMRMIDLPPGEYLVQAIYNYWLVATWLNDPGSAEHRPTDGTGDEPRVKFTFSEAQMDEPMAISEPVKFVVTAERTPAIDVASTLDRPLRLGLEPPTIRPTQPVPHASICEVPFRITNQSDDTITVFNPRLNTRYFWKKQVAGLDVLSADGEFIGDSFDLEFGSVRTPRKYDWVRFPPGGTVSSVARFRPDLVPLVQFADTGRTGLSPGKYFLELRGHQAFLTPPPAIVDQTDDVTAIRTDPAYQAWYRTFPGPEICRSNRVELEILPRTGD